MNHHNPPRPYALETASEWARLFYELRGYLRVSLADGTDTDGRRYAHEALDAVLAIDRRSCGGFAQEVAIDWRKNVSELFEGEGEG